MVRQFERLIASRESPAAPSDADALRSLMEQVNRQEEYFEEARQAICDAPQTPVRMHEQITNVMSAQWRRGSEWAVSHARAFRDEVVTRAKQGIAACPQEKLRIMWVGAGLWYDLDFYTAFEQSHGAVFVWSMYLAFGPDGYIRYGLDDPLLALASRTVSMNEQLHNPLMKRKRMDCHAGGAIDSASMLPLFLTPLGTRPSGYRYAFCGVGFGTGGDSCLPRARGHGRRTVMGRPSNARERAAKFLDTATSAKCRLKSDEATKARRESAP